MGLFDVLFNGKKKNEAVKYALQNGAKVIDVRSVGEFNDGHYEGALNIPVEKLAANINKIQRFGVPIVVYCASGMRSADAARILKTNGIEAYNGKTMNNVYNLATD